jgi:regulatory protein
LTEGDGNTETVRKQALAMLARREHSSAELRSKLAAKGFPFDAIKLALSDLDREGWLSDERFIEVFIRARRDRGYGPVRIRAELRERGIDDAEIAAFLDVRDPAWLQVLKKLWAKRFGAVRPADFAERARHMRFFQARGFTAEQIRAVIERGESGQ